jgi:hypothetical protein
MKLPLIVIGVALALACAAWAWTAFHPSSIASYDQENIVTMFKENGLELVEMGPQVPRTIHDRDYVASKVLVKRELFGMKIPLTLGFLTDPQARTMSFLPAETLERFLQTGDDSLLPKKPDLTVH